MDKQLEFDFEDKPNRLTYEEYFLNKWTEYQMDKPIDDIYYIQQTHENPSVPITIDLIKTLMMERVRETYSHNIARPISEAIHSIKKELNSFLYYIKMKNQLYDFLTEVDYDFTTNNIKIYTHLKMTQRIGFININFEIRN